MSDWVVEVSDPRFESEGLRLVTVRSAALDGFADITLVPGVPDAGRPRGLVVLLHGIGGSHWNWTLLGGVHQTLRRLVHEGTIPPMAIAMPSEGLWPDGDIYRRQPGMDVAHWIISEVPAVAREISGLEEDAPFFLGGLSLGGYTALHLGARHAGQVRAVSAHSAITRRVEVVAYGIDSMDAASDGPEAFPDIIDVMRSVDVTALPTLRFDCGRDDPLIHANRKLHRDLEVLGIDHRFEERPGRHDWAYWSQQVAASLNWFALHL